MENLHVDGESCFYMENWNKVVLKRFWRRIPHCFLKQYGAMPSQVLRPSYNAPFYAKCN
jgi:hypothetical protein